MKNIIKAFLTCLLILSVACNQQNKKASGKDVKPEDLDPRFLKSMLIVDNTKLVVEVLDNIDFSVKLDNNNVFVNTDNSSTEYKVELLDQNNQHPDWLKEDSKFTLTKQNPVKHLSFHPSIEQKGELKIHVVRNNVDTIQNQSIEYEASPISENNDFVKISALDSKFAVEASDLSFAVKFDTQSRKIINDDLDTEYKISLVDQYGKEIDPKHTHVIFQALSFYKKDFSLQQRYLVKHIYLKPIALLAKADFYILVKKKTGDIETDLKQGKCRSFSIIDNGDTSDSFIISASVINLHANAISTVDIQYKQPTFIRNQTKGLNRAIQEEYKVDIVDVNKKPFDSTIFKSTPASFIQDEYTQEWVLNSPLTISVTDSIDNENFYLKITHLVDGKIESETISDKIYYYQVFDSEDSVLVGDESRSIKLEKLKSGYMHAKLNLSSQEVIRDVNDTVYTLEFLTKDGKPLPTDILRIDSRVLPVLEKGKLEEIDIPVTVGAHVSDVDYRLNVKKSVVSTVQSNAYNLSIIDQDAVILGQNEVVIPVQNSVFVYANINFSSDYTLVIPSGAKYEVSIVDENGNEFDKSIIDVKPVQLIKDTLNTGAITMSVNSALGKTNFRLAFSVNGEKKISKTVYYFLTAGNDKDLTINNSTIPSIPGTENIWHGDKYFYTVAYADVAVDNFGTIKGAFLTSDPEVDAKYHPFLITDRFTNIFANAEKLAVCDLSETFYEGRQYIDMKASSANMFIFTPSCIRQGTVHINGRQFYSNGNGLHMIEAGDVLTFDSVDNISGDGHYIVSHYNARNTIMSYDTISNNLTKLNISDIIDISSARVINVTNDGSITLYYDHGRENPKVQRFYRCSAFTGMCSKLGKDLLNVTAVSMSSNGQYLYAALNDQDHSAINKMEISTGDLQPVSGLSGFSQELTMQVTDEGTLIINDVDQKLSGVYSSTKNKQILLTKLAAKYDISNFLGFANVSDNGKYILFHDTVYNEDANYVKYSALYRKYRPNGIENDIT